MPSRPLLYAVYLALSVVGILGVMRNPASHNTGTLSEYIFVSPSPMHPSNPSIPLRKRYIGINAVDSVLAILVSSFLDGATGAERDIQVQQANFMLSWTGVLVVWSLEAARIRNRGKLISMTSLLTLFYQTLSGAFVVPLYCLLFTYATASSRYDRSTAIIPNDRARALIPAILFGYVLPTLSLYYPFKSTNVHQIVIAAWQISPLLVNILWAFLTPSTEPISLQSIYWGGAGMTSLSHLSTIYLCASGYVDWEKVWLPIINKDTPYGQAIKFSFQWDYIVIFTSTTLWAFSEVSRIKKTVDPKVNTALAGLGMAVGAVVFGPAAVLCISWAWREQKLAGKRAA